MTEAILYHSSIWGVPNPLWASDTVIMMEVEKYWET